MEKHGGRDAISCLLPCVLYFMESELIMFNVWVTVGTRNLWRHQCKALLWRKFVGELRTTTNCRLTFIDLYLVFTNFRIVFLPHTKTVILLELYCGTITETGLPVAPVISWGLLMGWAPWEWGLLTPSCFYSCRLIKKPNKMKSKTDLKKYNKR